MIYPDYGINGSGARNLAEDARCALLKLADAIKALRAIHPHGRDYQAFEYMHDTAVREHEARLTALTSVLTDVAALHSNHEANA